MRCREGLLGLGLLLGACASPPRTTVPPRHQLEPVPPRVVTPAPSPAPSVVRPVDPAPVRDRILTTARTYLGTPYRYGGLSREGIDCSGLVHTVYRRHGVAVPRTSWRQARAGTPVARDDLSPGDLVFFRGDGSGVRHVGIYTGGGRFLHASTRHREVRVDSLDARYFRDHFVGGRDVLGASAAR